mmetsp:Transcript_9509/g.14607  ORF Transcript_9509/g.14607 Transcript_9509/m.14607 type:complete len:479 (+) Transcript_9509:187-1623(+)
MLRQARSTVMRTFAAGTLTVGLIEVTTHLPSESRSSLFYHHVCDNVVTPALRYTLDPETAHNVALEFARRGFGPKFHPSAIEQTSIKTSIAPFPNAASLTFDNCVGLAAGFDKNGEAIQAMSEMGFGFVEIGSVTPEPQPGNPKPRMYRLTEDLGVINRYGFNSKGVDEVEDNLKQFHSTRPPSQDASSADDDHNTMEVVLHKIQTSFKWITKSLQKSWETPSPIVGVNLGKNKTSVDEIADYKRGIRQLGPYADYLVINVSSPNTPGLRDLQAAEPLKKLLREAVQARNELSPRTRPQPSSQDSDFLPPLLVKLAPDLDDTQLQQTIEAIMECQIDGIVVTNTTLARPSSLQSEHQEESGGLSGAPVRDMSTECIRKVYKLTKGTIPIVGVGGVGSGHDVYEKLKAGASLVQIYSMMVYQGPGVISRIRKDLAELMVQNGQRSVDDVIGVDHEDLYWEKRLALQQKKEQHEQVIVDE